MDQLVFFTNPQSRGRIVRWMLEEIGQPYRTALLEYGTTMKAPDYREINPMGKVPAIRHGTTVVTETAAICAYLADAFPTARLAPPADSALRGPYYRWLFFAAGPIDQVVAAQSCGWTVPQERSGMVGFGSLPAVLDAIEGALKGRDYVVGDGFTAADIVLAANVAFGMQMGIFEQRPAFGPYVQRLYARPAAVRAGVIDDELTAKQKDGRT